MTREIKFRVWDKVLNQYVKGLAVFGNGTIIHVGQDLDETYLVANENIIVEQHPENLIIEQFTGLKDENGKSIYENDLIKYIAEDGDYFVAPVKYMNNEGYPAFDIPIEYIPDGYYFESNVLSTGVVEEAIKVIGNIHNNKDLLDR